MKFLTLFPSMPVGVLPDYNGRKPTGANVKRKRHSCPSYHQKSPDF
ncbi:hypothetical protein [Flammeovirga sp. SJP92]|nr:hypothetical protein [Flammeovirga sp. SJP92]